MLVDLPACSVRSYSQEPAEPVVVADAVAVALYSMVYTCTRHEGGIMGMV